MKHPNIEAIRDSLDKHLGTTLRAVCVRVIDHPLFATAYGSAGEHHCFEGGLAAHTSEVLDYALGMVKLMPESDIEAVVTAAVFHDFMKIKEYNVTYPMGLLTVTKSPYRNLVRHVAGSHAEFVRFTADIDESLLTPNQRLKIEHAILAHHGRREWGSPIEPQLVEAYIINFADQLSVRFGPQSKGTHDRIHRTR